MKVLCYHKLSIAFTTSLFILLFAVHMVSAAEIIYSDQVPNQPTDWGTTLEIPSFDPALGQLQGVEIQMIGFVRGEVGFENTGPSSAIISASHGVTVALQLLDMTTLITTPTASRVEVLPAFDGIADFAGASGRTAVLSSTEFITRLLTAPADLALYIGLGQLQFPVTATGDSNLVGPGNQSALLRAQASSAVLTIIYRFNGPGIQIQKLTNGADADSPNGLDVPILTPGQAVTWTYIVTNTGDIPFLGASVVVTDSHAGITPTLDSTSDVGSDDILSPGESWIYTATGQAADLSTPPLGVAIVNGCNPTGGVTPGERETYRNIGRVTVPQLSNEDPSHYCNPPQPAVVLKKFTNGADADDANGTDVPQLVPGQTVTWTYVVTNTGNVAFALASVVVTDSQPGIMPTLDSSSDAGTDLILSPGESWTFVATGQVETLTTPTLGVTVVNGCNPAGAQAPGTRSTYVNIGRVTVPGSTDDDPSHYCNPPLPGIVIQKFTNGADADSPNGLDVPILTPGQAVTWTYIVTNTGDIPFLGASVVVTDSHTSIIPTWDSTSDAGNDGILSPGESWTYTATGIAENLRFPLDSITLVIGCHPTAIDELDDQHAYMNIGHVQTPDVQAEDVSHYCNPPPPAPPAALAEEQEPEEERLTHLTFLPLLR